MFKLVVMSVLLSAHQAYSSEENQLSKTSWVYEKFCTEVEASAGKPSLTNGVTLRKEFDEFVSYQKYHNDSRNSDMDATPYKLISYNRTQSIYEPNTFTDILQFWSWTQCFDITFTLKCEARDNVMSLCSAESTCLENAPCKKINKFINLITDNLLISTLICTCVVILISLGCFVARKTCAKQRKLKKSASKTTLVNNCDV